MIRLGEISDLKGWVRPFGLFAIFLVYGCSTLSQPYDPANVRPVYELRNSPFPVPWPNNRPNRAHMQQQARQQASSGIKVGKGQTLYGLSRKYGVSVRDLIAANGLKAPYVLHIGQSLRLPRPNIHTVKKGETGYSISRQYSLNVNELMRLNNIRAPYRLAVGQKLELPASAKRQVVAKNAVAAKSQTKKPSVKNRKSAQSRPRKKTPNVPARTGNGKFSWPVSGTLASRFGPKEGGLHNDGINIIAPLGAPVRAAEAGVVVYASNALEGYGNLLLLKHSGGWVTAYAHNERLLVRDGQTVKRGDVIARVGSSGGVVKPQLHFEIRKGRQAFDPLRLLEKKVAAAR